MMIDPDCDHKTATFCSKNISFCEKETVRIRSPPDTDTDTNIRTDEADEDSILMGNDTTTIKSLECCQTSISNSAQLITDEKALKRKSTRLSFSYVGSLFSKIVRKVSNVSSDSAERRTKKYECINLENLELAPIVEHMQSHQKFLSSNFLPGVVGLTNQGNACYMNAVLQCLSNTELLTAYFLSDRYRTCLKLNQSGRSCSRFSNLSTFAHSTTTLNSGSEHSSGQDIGKKLHSRSKGLVTEHLALLIRSLWSGRYCNEVSSRFKALVGRMGKQFKGSTQQDAHEFLLWLLDQLHEDLSIGIDAHKKKSCKAKSCTKGNTSLDESSAVGSTDSASPSLPNQTSTSAINDLFQAHYRSSLTCLKCGHKSHTIDPFLSISLSILSSSSLSLGIKHPIYVVVVYLSATPKQVRIGLQMKHGCTIKDLRDTISNDTNIPREQLVLADMRLDGYVTTLFDDQPIEKFRNLSSIYAIETSKHDPSGSCVILVVVNKFANGTQYEMFGEPVVLHMDKNSRFFDLQQDLFFAMKQHLLVDLNSRFFTRSFLDYRLVNFEDRSECYYLGSTPDPLLSPPVEKALTRCKSGPRHVLAIAEWYQMTRSDFSVGMNDSCVEHESVNVVRSSQYSSLCSLEDCFHAYTQKEQLGADNAWYCPSCNKKQVETLKTLTLYSLPKILVVHLKRFKHDSSQRSKLDTFVTFPARDLDLSDYLSKATRHSVSMTIKTPSVVMTTSNCQAAGTTSGQNYATSDERSVLVTKNSNGSNSSVNPNKQQSCKVTSVESSLDCPPIIMKSIPNEKAPLTAGSTNHVTASRKLSNGSAQNDTKSKNNYTFDSPSIADLSTNRVSCTTSEMSLGDIQQSCHDICKKELYDLYAVCNHYGNLYDGHYTAYCKNPLNNSWYLYNDTQVGPIREEDIITRHAYLLFYRKKTTQSLSPLSRPSCCAPTSSPSACEQQEKDKVIDLQEDEDDGNAEVPDVESKEILKKGSTGPQQQNQVLSSSGSVKSRKSPSTSSSSRFKSRVITDISAQPPATNSPNDHNPLDEGHAPTDKDKLSLMSNSTKCKDNILQEDPNIPKSFSKDVDCKGCIKEIRERNCSDKSIKSKPSKRSKRNLMDCTRFCIFSSNESVICSDVQLSQLHSLQESRV